MGKNRKFERTDGTGITEEWIDSNGYVLAYLDRFHSHPMANVSLFTPEVQKVREHFGRKPQNAKAIIERHLERQGWKETD